MEFLKDLFGENQLGWDAFMKAVKDAGYKIADLSKGEYVSKNKYDDDLKNKDTEITNLTTQLGTRDNDLKKLQEQLSNSKNDADTVKNLNKQLNDLQANYDNAKTQYEKQIAEQQMKFAVKEFANKQNFTSKAAKNQFIQSMLEKQLTLDNGNLVGASDYLESYKSENADSFAVEEPEDNKKKPQFTDKTKTEKKEEENPFIAAMHFTGVRKQPEE